MSVSPGYLPAIMFTGSREESTEFSEDGTVVKYSVKPRFPYIDCPECGESLISNGNAPVKWVRDLPSGGMQVVYEVHCKRYRCPSCGKTCSENLDCIFDARYTNAYTESANNIIKGVEKQGKGYDFDTLKKIVLFSCRNPRDPNAKPRTLSFRQDHMQ